DRDAQDPGGAPRRQSRGQVRRGARRLLLAVPHPALPGARRLADARSGRARVRAAARAARGAPRPRRGRLLVGARPWADERGFPRTRGRAERERRRRNRLSRVHPLPDGADRLYLVTTKLVELVAEPLGVVTRIGPVFAPFGTVALI